jgi:XTP/dITP diphosphohydrolase
MKIFLASNNAKKRKELERILAALSLVVATPRDLGIDLEPDECGDTFAANAKIKALAFASHTDLPILADDSGLEVDALDGAPGVRSARYSGDAATDESNRAKLLRELAAVPAERRTARFVCALALCRGGEIVAEVEGRCEGRILTGARGDGGFGYDPLFLHEPSGRTFAELDAAVKDTVSHRGVALRRLAPHLQVLLLSGT